MAEKEEIIVRELPYSEVVKLVEKLAAESNTNPDYAENDPSKKSYILNRLFYETGEPAATYTPESYSINTESWLLRAGLVTTDIIKATALKNYFITVKLYSELDGSTENLEYSLDQLTGSAAYVDGKVVGHKYTIDVGRSEFQRATVYMIYDYEAYNSVVEDYRHPEFTSNGVYLCRGDYDTFSTGEPVSYSNITTVTSLNRISTLKVHKLPNRFIDLLTHADFKALKEAVETKSFDSLTDKPFYVNGTVKEILSGMRLDGHIVEFNKDSGQIWLAYQISENTYTKEQLLGGTVTATTDTYTIDSSHIVEDTADGLCLRFDGTEYYYVWVAYTTNYQPELFDAPLPAVGVYFSQYTSSGGEEMLAIKRVDLELEVIEHLDNKFLNLLNNRDFKTLQAKVEGGRLSGGLIDVDTLPTNNIDAKAIYRVKENVPFCYTLYNGKQGDYRDIPLRMHVVNTLPTVGEHYVDDPRTRFVIYFQRSDSAAYAYVGAEEKRWVSAETVGAPYILVYSPESATAANNLYIVQTVIHKYRLYTYTENGWSELRTDNVIIDVTSLPTQNINEDVFYRLITARFLYGQYINTDWTMYTVDTLPETGEMCWDGAVAIAYYSLTDNNTYGYVNDALSATMGVPVGWYTANVLISAIGSSYGGIISDITQAEDETVYTYLSMALCSYKNGVWADATTETDPTVPDWAKQPDKPTYTASEVGAVPVTRTINGKTLSSNITLSASDVGAVPVTRTINGKTLSSNITLSASEVGAVPVTRTINGKTLSSNITLSASDVGASDFSGSYNDLSIRPFYDDNISLNIDDKIEGQDGTWENNGMLDTFGTVHRVSNEVYTAKQLIGASFVLHYSISGITEIGSTAGVLTNDNIITSSDYLIIRVGDTNAFVAYKDNCIVNLSYATVTLPIRGTYFAKAYIQDQYRWFESITKSDGPKKLDNKFLDLENNELIQSLLTRIEALENKA